MVKKVKARSRRNPVPKHDAILAELRHRISFWIRSIRAQMRVTREWMAAYLGVTYQTLLAWETGKSMPRADMLALLCIRLSAPPGKILGLEPRPDTPPGTVFSIPPEPPDPEATPERTSGRANGSPRRAARRG